MNDPCEGKYDIVPRLRDYINRDDNDIAEAAAYIERLRKERDEARRLYCEAVILHGTAHRADANGVPIEITDAAELARSLKWDCYGTEDMSER